MSHFIKPTSVDSYLSGICNQLEPFYPSVRASRRHPLVVRTLRGCKKLRNTATKRKRAIRRSELVMLAPRFGPTSAHDDLLFISILLVAFFALMRLGELVWPDNVELQDVRKVTMRSTVQMLPNNEGFSFFLPSHKADHFFEGNRVVVRKTDTADDPVLPFRHYLQSRDAAFPFHPQLWLRADGSVPTRGWFIRRLKTHFPGSDIGGHSLRAGGATALAEAGVPSHIIQAIGRWASETFQIYIRQHPMLLAALLYAH
ncbi:hypothetical protein HWV62_9029 [Athelia sp. TMB]|nr:hypothetical protein HWV62_7595 [Athelia sp. TMB]KAF7985118.1 hypothetical protein HWV62_9029 [Athelia sp. TMB]